MSGMTWNEFKKHVDAELARQGSTGNDAVARIQVALPQNNAPYAPEVHLHESSHGIIIDGGLIT